MMVVSYTSIELIDLVTNAIFIKTHAWSQHVFFEVETVSDEAVE